jgi:nucleotide-binding universal stress UspA family protein
MFQTIIVGVDGRPQDLEALALARQLGEPGAEIIAAKIAVLDRSMLGIAGLQPHDTALDGADAVVDALTESVDGVEGVVSGAESVGLGLRDVAVGAGADLIVISSSRRGLLGRAFVGDSGRDVLRHAPCAVAVATVGHLAKGPLRRVTVGYDGSGASKIALDEAVRVGRRDGARIDIVDVVDPAIAAAAITGAYVGNAVDDGYERARGQLERVLREYGLHGVVTTGRPAHELVRASRGSDLLAIGLHRRGLLDRLLLGSTAHALLREQCAPLLVTPPSSADGHHVADALDERDDQEPLADPLTTERVPAG